MTYSISLLNLKTKQSSLGESSVMFPKVYIGCVVLSLGLAGSPLGNPYHGMANTNRTLAIAKYRNWLNERLDDKDSEQSKEMERLKELVKLHKGVTLSCWCYPQQCHGEVIRTLLLKDLTNPLF